MPSAQSPRIHPTAVISAEAELAADVEVGPFVVIEGKVRVGPGCVIRPHVLLCGPLTMGKGNMVFSGTVLGERPQHLKYNDEPTGVEIGDDNVFREHVTVHRGTTASWITRVGSNNFFMANSHVAHDCQVGSRCIFANGAVIGGHCTIEDNVYLSGNCAVHQFVRIGRLALLSGASATTKDIPPFIIQQRIDSVVGVNVIGMRRAGLTNDQIDAVRRAYHTIFRDGHVLPSALALVEKELGEIDAVAEMIEFIRQSKRGINPARDRDAA
ncbi:MAG TPA: acyl-ACP--UDP-N-acetylglucosamine O-acyltransferase [Gemmataceae bacterium]|nr:acyl-ACP--UDP-N-acetylglucosamine O-acyltransferase [Gemmataceae bacterium]